LGCRVDCILDVSGCFSDGGVCGDGVLNVGESCDGGDFPGGSVLCSDFDSGFSGSCGDGFVNIGEECERDFSGEFVFGVVGDCVDYPDFVGGVLGTMDDTSLEVTSSVTPDAESAQKTARAF